MNKLLKSAIGYTLFVLVDVTLLLAFIVLKLCGVITWSWWWIMAPAWGLPIVVLLALGFLAMCVIILSSAVSHRRR